MCGPVLHSAPLPAPSLSRLQTRGQVWTRQPHRCLSAPAAPDQTRRVCSRGRFLGFLARLAQWAGGIAPASSPDHLVYSRHSVPTSQQPPVSSVVAPPSSTSPAVPVPVLEPAPFPAPAPTSPLEPRRPVTHTPAVVIPRVSYRNLSATTSLTPSPIPKNYRSTLADANWRAAMTAEYQALIDSGTWRHVPRPPGANVVTGKCIFTP